MRKGGEILVKSGMRDEGKVRREEGRWGKGKEREKKVKREREEGMDKRERKGKKKLYEN